MNQEKRSRFFDPYQQQRTQAGGRPGWGSSILSLVSIFGFSFSLTCLYLAMRGIMRLGGFVATGGPYEIAHPAPRYVWIFPVSIMVGLACIFLHGAQAGKVGGLNLVPLAWPALFISLGWNFLEFGFRPPGGGGLSWGWLVCGVMFWLMGFIPLILFFIYFRQRFQERRLGTKLREAREDGTGRGGNLTRRIIVPFQIAALFAGIWAAVLFLSPKTAAQETRPAAFRLTSRSG